MTSYIDLDHARKVALQAGEQAGSVLLSRFGTDLSITSKAHADFVTEVDKQCEDIIREVLGHFDETIVFIGEESISDSFVTQDGLFNLPDTCWIVDPLDGTSNYMHSFEGYSTSIALRVDGEIVCGLVTAPSMGMYFHSIKGQGVFENRNGIDKELHVKDNGNDMNLCSFPTPYRHRDHIDSHLELSKKFHKNFEDLRRVGSAALDLSWVARGSWSAYIERFLHPWDYAAGGLFVKEAGGIMSDLSGDLNTWVTKGEFIACVSPRVHELVLNLIE